MIQDFGGLPVQIGEAEIEQTTGRASGRFIPGPGYASVRDVFLLRNQGDRSAYLDARDRLWPQLYHDGVPMAAGDLHIDDPDRIEADLDNWEPVDGPAVGSRGELAAAMQFSCLACGGGTHERDLVYALPGSRLAARALFYCTTCRKGWTVVYPATPEWKQA